MRRAGAVLVAWVVLGEFAGEVFELFALLRSCLVQTFLGALAQLLAVLGHAIHLIARVAHFLELIGDAFEFFGTGEFVGEVLGGWVVGGLGGVV